MSVRAYRVIEIKREDSPTFSLWGSEELMSYLQSIGNWMTNDGAGFVEFFYDDLKEALANAVVDKVSQETIGILNKMLKQTGGKDGSVMYDLF